MEYLINFFTDHPQSVGVLIATGLGLFAIILATAIGYLVEYALSRGNRQRRKKVLNEVKRFNKQKAIEKEIFTGWSNNERKGIVNDDMIIIDEDITYD